MTERSAFPSEHGTLPRRPPGSEVDHFRSRLRSAPPPIDNDVRTAAMLVGQPPESDDEYRAQVGRRVRLARVAREDSQLQAADRAGLTRNWVSAIERGAITLDAWRLLRLAESLGVGVSWLLGLPEGSGGSR